jgi:hypothetical protein
MEVDAARNGFPLHEKSNQSIVGRSMKIGDLVRLTGDGVIAAWYPGIDHGAVGVAIKVVAWKELDEETKSCVPPDLDQTTWVLVEWPRGRDYHTPQDLDIIRKHFS